MISRFPWKALTIGSAIIGGIGALVRSSRRTSSPPRVALIGDSYAVGLGPELDKLLPDFKVEGHVGTNTAQWASHAAACGSCGDWLTAFKPDVVLVALGVNDGAASNAANYQTIVRALHGIGARVVWVEPPARVAAPATRKIVESLNVPFIPGVDIPLAADGLHPTSYAGWAREIAQVVNRG